MSTPSLSPYRKALIDLLRPLDPRRGCEVGVHKGATSYWLLKSFPKLLLWMIDPWTAHDEDSDYWQGGDPIARLSREQQWECADQAAIVTDFARDRAIQVRMTSLEALPHIEDCSQSFVFIDADHSEQAVLADARAWWPKVMTGGYLIFHDYGNDASRHTEGVKPAVDQFAAEIGLPVQAADGWLAFILKTTMR